MMIQTLMNRRNGMETNINNDLNTLFNRIECMLFAAGDPVPITEIARVLGKTKEEATALLTEMELQRSSESRGIIPMVTGETAQMTSNRAYFDDVENLLNPDKKKTVSQSIMETLSVIAYRQPVTRADIENVRGVRCDYAVSQLLNMGLICECGHRDTPGHPSLFSTTDRFLRYFGIHSLDELPAFPDPKDDENNPEDMPT